MALMPVRTLDVARPLPGDSPCNHNALGALCNSDCDECQWVFTPLKDGAVLPLRKRLVTSNVSAFACLAASSALSVTASRRTGALSCHGDGR